MTGTSWIALLGILAVTAGLSFSAMKKLGDPLPEYKKPEPKTVVATVKPEDATATANATGNRVAPTNRNWDVLWKNSLFKDDRTEDVIEETQPDANPEDLPVNTDFELIGVVCMGREDAATPIAIIQQAIRFGRNRGQNNGGPNGNQPNGPGNNRGGRGNWNGNAPGGQGMSGRPGMQGGQGMQGGPGSFGGPGMPGGPGMFGNNGMPGMRNWMNPNASTDPEDRKTDKSLYREGDTIKDTDYVVKSINVEEHKVILTRNGQDMVLILDEQNTGNSIRREIVKRQELAQREKYTQPTNNGQQNNNQVRPNQFGPGGMRGPGQFGQGGMRGPGQFGQGGMRGPGQFGQGGMQAPRGLNGNSRNNNGQQGGFSGRRSNSPIPQRPM